MRKGIATIAAVAAMILPAAQAGATGQLACTLAGSVVLSTQSDLRASASGTGSFDTVLSALACAGAVNGQGSVDASSFCFAPHNGVNSCEDGSASNVPSLVYNSMGPVVAHVKGSATFSGFVDLVTPGSCGLNFNGHGGPGFGELILTLNCGTATDGVGLATFAPLLGPCADLVPTCFDTVAFVGVIEG